MKLKEIVHYAYFLMLSSDTKEQVKDIVTRDLADIENKINEHTNSKLNKIAVEIESLKRTKDNFGSKSYNLNLDITLNVALDATIEIIKKEITKTK